jgi:two-component system, cell cycle sensor histidine kinase and response regulator CckA
MRVLIKATKNKDYTLHLSDTLDMKLAESNSTESTNSLRAGLRRVERRQWWLSFSGVLVTLLLTLGIVSLSLTIFILQRQLWDALNIHLAMRGLVGMVFLFVVYVVYQQLQIHRFRMHVLAQEELFSLIGENAADMIAVVTIHGERVYNSPSYQKLLGYTPEDLESTSAYEQIHPDDQPAVKVAADEAKKTGIGRRVEYRIRHKNGEWRVLESTASAVRNSNGDVEKLVIVNRDITERRHLEQQLLLSQRLEAVGKLSGGIAHDFNNILGVIIGYSEALQQTMATDDPMREAIDEIEKAGQRAAALTQQLLAFSRKQVLEPKILDLNSIVSEVEKMLRRLIGEDVELEIISTPTLGRVKADRGQIEQVILNLAVNARDAMPRGGKLKIETMNADLDENDARRTRYVVPGHYVMLQVSDTGMGMTAEVQAHIFEPFYTTKEQGKGTGLGLATVYGVVKQSGGYIWVESEVGKGSKFQVYLPLAEGAEPETVRNEPSFTAHASGTILVAEDEPSLLKLTCKTLKESGYKVLEAEDGPKALQVARKFDNDIHLLLTDVVMRDMNGRELAAKMSSERPRMKVLYMSGYTDGAVATHGVLESGIVILRKPFSRAQLLRQVEEMLAQLAGKGVAEENVEHTTNR